MLMSSTIHKPIPQKPNLSCSILSSLSYNLPALDELVNNCFLNSVGLLSDITKIHQVKKFEAYLKLVHCLENLNFLIEIYKYEYYFEKLVGQGCYTPVIKKKISKTVSRQSDFLDTNYAFVSTIDDLDVPLDTSNLSEMQNGIWNDLSPDVSSSSTPLSIDLRQLTNSISKDLPVHQFDTVPSSSVIPCIETVQSSTSSNTITASQELPKAPDCPPQNPEPTAEIKLPQYPKLTESSSAIPVNSAPNNNSSRPSKFDQSNQFDKIPTTSSIPTSPIKFPYPYQQSFQSSSDHSNAILNSSVPSSSIQKLDSRKLEHSMTKSSTDTTDGDEFYFVDDFDKQVLDNQWNLIVSRYVVPNAPEQINLSQTELDLILQEDQYNKVHNPNKLLKARNEIMHLIKENAYTSFISKEKTSIKSGSPSPCLSPISPYIKAQLNRFAYSPTSLSEEPISKCDLKQKAASTQISPVQSSTELGFTTRNSSKTRRHKKIGSGPYSQSGTVTPIANGHSSPTSSNSSSFVLSNLLGHLKISTPLSYNSVSTSPVPEKDSPKTDSSSLHLKFWAKRRHS